MFRFGIPSYWNPTSSTLYVGPNPYHDHFYSGWSLLSETRTTNHYQLTTCYVSGKDLSGTIDGAGGVGGLLATEVGGVWYFPLYDNNGNVTDYVSETGEVVASYTYDAFGRTIAQSGTMADVFPFRFSTKYYDAESGLYYYGYRYYSPELGRWLTRDPIEEDGGDNLYAFCGNNGIGRVDPMGETTVQLNTKFEFDTQEGSDQPTFPVIAISATVLTEPEGWNFLNFIQLKKNTRGGVWELDKKGDWPYYYQKSELARYVSKDEHGHRVLTLKDSPRGAYSESWDFVSSVVEVSRTCRKVLPSGLGRLCKDKVKVLDAVRWKFDYDAPLLRSLSVSQDTDGPSIMRQTLPELVKDKLWQIEWYCPTQLEIE